MAWPTWIKERLAQADLVNLGVIVAFAILLGFGGVVAMQNDADALPPGDPKDDDDEERDERDDDDDDSSGKGGKGNDDDDDDDD